MEDLAIAYIHFCGCYGKGAPPLTELEFKLYCERLVASFASLEEG